PPRARSTPRRRRLRPRPRTRSDARRSRPRRATARGGRGARAAGGRVPAAAARGAPPQASAGSLRSAQSRKASNRLTLTLVAGALVSPPLSTRLSPDRRAAQALRRALDRLGYTGEA